MTTNAEWEDRVSIIGKRRKGGREGGKEGREGKEEEEKEEGRDRDVEWAQNYNDALGKSRGGGAGPADPAAAVGRSFTRLPSNQLLVPISQTNAILLAPGLKRQEA